MRAQTYFLQKKTCVFDYFVVILQREILKEMKKIVVTSLILSIIACLAIGMVIVYMTCASNDVDMSLGEGMIGIIVALLALIVTIILGWQIYTVLLISKRKYQQ